MNNKSGINVLSLFDGISCGQIALERAGIKVNNYFASEIDKHAITVTQHNYPSTIQLGNVNKWKKWNLPKIDLLIGGSPCQGFSFAGKQLNFKDPRSKLFFKYVDILKSLRKQNSNIQFLLENVKMKKEFMDIISHCLNVEPVLINSSLVSAQERKRLYWTNISQSVSQPEDKNIDFYSVLQKPILYSELKNWTQGYYAGRKRLDILRSVFDKKSFTITTNQTHNKHYYVNEDKTLLHLLTPIERERLQTIDDNYTNMIPKTARCSVLGNCWTVDVATHIFALRA